MNMNYGDRDRAEWQPTEEQWEEEQQDPQTQMDHGNGGEAEASDNEYGAGVTFYEQEKQQWGRQNSNRADMGVQEGAKRGRQGENPEKNKSYESSAQVIQGRVINYVIQAKKPQEENIRREHYGEDNARHWERQKQDRERIRQLEEQVEKTNRKNEEMVARMLEKEEQREKRGGRREA